MDKYTIAAALAFGLTIFGSSAIAQQQYPQRAPWPAPTPYGTPPYVVIIPDTRQPNYQYNGAGQSDQRTLDNSGTGGRY